MKVARLRLECVDRIAPHPAAPGGCGGPPGDVDGGAATVAGAATPASSGTEGLQPGRHRLRRPRQVEPGPVRPGRPTSRGTGRRAPA